MAAQFKISTQLLNRYQNDLIEQQQFFNSNQPYTDNIITIENRSGEFYRHLSQQIQLLIKSSNLQEVKQIELQLAHNQSSIIYYFFGSFPDQFIYDQNFLNGMQKLGQTLKITIDLCSFRQEKLTLKYQDQISTVCLMIYQSPQKINQMSFMFAKRDKFKMLTPTFKNFQTPNCGNQQNVQMINNGQNLKLSTPNYNQNIQIQNRPQINIQPNTQIQSSTQVVNQQSPKLFQKNQGLINEENFNLTSSLIFPKPIQQQAQPQFGFNEPTLQVKKQPNQNLAKSCFLESSKSAEQEAQSLLETEQINKNLLENNSNQQGRQSAPCFHHARVESIKLEKCPICWNLFKINNDESVLTSCCSKNLHKLCFLKNIDEKAPTCSKFNQLQCYNCGKEIDLSFLKIHLNKKLFFEISFKESLTLTDQRCYQCQTPLILTKQEKIICPNLCCKKEICSKCLKQYHGENSQCPQIQKYILDVLKGQPIIFCPFCNQIQTKDNNCDHVKCAGCKNDLCSECSCDRRPILSHGNHFHRVGCKHWKGEESQLTKMSELKRECAQCKQFGACKKPQPLDDYKKLKNY